MTSSATVIYHFLKRQSVQQIQALFGRACIGCEQQCKTAICESCIKDVTKPQCVCRICGIAMQATSHSMRCQSCLHSRPSYECLHYIADYTSRLTHWIIGAKLGKQAEAIEALRTLTKLHWYEHAEYYHEQYKEFYLLPMPIPKSRLLMRGFNLPRIIATEINAISGLPILPSNCLTLPWYTSKQAKLSKTQRLNRKWVYQVNDNLPTNILLIDDVVTTGKTIDSLATLLREVNIARVSAWSLARTQQS